MKHTVEKLKFVKRALFLSKSLTVKELMRENDLAKQLVLSEEIAETSEQIMTITRAISILESWGRDAERISKLFNL